jgi:hypothetical protein
MQNVQLQKNFLHIQQTQHKVLAKKFSYANSHINKSLVFFTAKIRYLFLELWDQKINY